MGNLGDRFGRKRLLLFGGSLFALISVGAAYSANAEMLIVYRALLGVAGATLMPSTCPPALDVQRHGRTKLRDRGVERHGCGRAAAGPLFGGALLQYFWWGSVFLVNVPIMALVLLIGLPALRESKDPAPGRLDLLSVVLSMVGILGVVYAIKETAIRGFEVGYFTAGVIGVVCLTWFVLRQKRRNIPWWMSACSPARHSPVRCSRRCCRCSVWPGHCSSPSTCSSSRAWNRCRPACSSCPQHWPRWWPH